jgi:hypothetical protein
MELALVLFNKINKGTIKAFNTFYIRVLQLVFRECFPWGIVNQADNQNDMELKFNLDTINACCIQVH